MAALPAKPAFDLDQSAGSAPTAARRPPRLYCKDTSRPKTLNGVLGMKPATTWILVADAARARVLATTGPETPLVQVPDFNLEAPHQKTSDIMSDKPGRTFQSVGSKRSAYEPHEDPHRALKKSFAHQLADLLEEKAKAGAFDRVVLVSPPAFLGDLRAVMSEAVRGRVHGEVAKDLTKTPNNEIRSHLGDVVV
ncbi:MAG: host attachment protein [Hyphomicrobiaceae bacterium]|nr:MAG: host attachment protein [Hyphomicrobiaceae bacterium]